MHTVLLSEFMQLVDLIKPLKNGTVILFNRTIYGLDESQSYLKTVTSEIISPLSCHNFAISYSGITEFIKNINIINILEDVIYIDYHNRRIFHPSSDTNIIYLKDLTQYSHIIMNMNNDLTVCQKAINYEDLKNDVNFVSIMTNKTADGMSLFKKDGYCMSLFSGVLPINKSDKVTLSIYDLNEFSFIARFGILKAKKVIVNAYIRYMKLS